MLAHVLLGVAFAILTEAYGLKYVGNAFRAIGTVDNARVRPQGGRTIIGSRLADSTSALAFNLDNRTSTCLDFDVVLNELKESTLTVRGTALAGHMQYATAEEVSTAYAMVEEIRPQLQVIPLRSSMNVWDIMRMIEVGTPPERDDIVSFSTVVEEVEELVEFLEENEVKLPLTSGLALDMMLPEEIIAAFDGAFDEEGHLFAEKYPEIAQLRKDTQALKTKITQIIKGLLSSPTMKEKLADSGYIEIEGRYCIMLKNTYKKGLGIVHGSSNTGRSIYVEPTEVVQPTNDLKLAQAELKKEENAVFLDMCKTIARNRNAISASLEAVGRLDVLRAKAALGERLRGVVPDVGTEGVVRCVNARHPVLLMRGVDAVGNTIELNSDSPGLVISGPNAGGKTIVLKTIGLMAMMVRHAVPIPALQGARMDMFDVMADIGDMQTVSGDLSTFSGHLVVCKEMMERAKECAHPLVLLDEIGTGTDPAQGAALAQAILENLVKSNSRVIVTTHYQRVKELAAEGSSFKIAAMEFLENRPTYRLRMGSVGESFAIEAGQRMGLPSDVLVRAESLLDDETRRLVALQQRLEEEVAQARAQQTQAQTRATELEAERNAVETAKKALEDELAGVRDGAIEKYLQDVKDKERQLEDLIDQAKRAAASGSSKEVEAVKLSVNEARISIEKEMVATVAAVEDIGTPLVPGEQIEVGTTLIVLEKGNMFGTRGVVTRRNKGRGRVLMRVSGVEVKYERHLLGTPTLTGVLSGFGKGSSGAKGTMEDRTQMSAKDRRMLEMLESELVDPEQLLKKHRGAKESPRSGVRLSSNTLDGRNLDLQALKPKTADFIERIAAKNELGVLYINHGKTKSAESVKSKVRTWLKKHPLVRSVKGASATDGGDAYTFVELDLSD